MLDELRQIAIFAKAIDHGSFKGAADELRLAPSVISHHISQLEEKLGVTLIYRSTRSLSLTPQGERLLASARVMNGAIGTALDELRSTLREPSGVLRITITAGLSQSSLVQSICDFCARYPKIDVQLEFSDETRHLINDGFDLSIEVGRSTDNTQNRQTLFWGRRCIVGATTYLAQHGLACEPDDLEEFRWVVRAGVKASKAILRKTGSPDAVIEPAGQISADSSVAVYSFAKAGAGIAIIPEFLAVDDIANGTMQIVLPDWSLDALDVFAQWPANASKDSIVRLFVADLQSAMAAPLPAI